MDFAVLTHLLALSLYAHANLDLTVNKSCWCSYVLVQ